MEDRGVSKRGVVNESVYSSLLQEVEESVALSRCMGRNLSPQFLRRRLFEGDMEFVPLYKLYSFFGVPSALILGRFGDRVFSVNGERGIVASHSHRELFEKLVVEMQTGIKQYAGLFPQTCRSILDAVFNPQRSFDSEIETCAHVTSSRRELAVEVLTGYDMIMHAHKSVKSAAGIPPGSHYSRLGDVSAEYHVRQNIIRRLKDVDVFEAGGTTYVRMDHVMAGVLERISSKRQNGDVLDSSKSG